MKEISTAEMKRIQQSILDKVHVFCSEHNITYFLAAGTLLGAIRHGGYIPWDDDIDLYMLREDYDRIESIFNSNPPQNLRLLSLNTERMYIYPFIKIEDTTTLLLENNNSYVCGINIDVFPIDGIPENQNEIKRLYKKLTFYEALDSIKTTKLSRTRSLHRNIILALGKVLTSVISLRLLSQKRAACICDHKYDSQYVGELSTFAYRKQFPRKLFKESTEVLFEGKYYNSPKDWDSFLRLKFGDYMKLPPIEQQVTHHRFRAYMK